MSYSNEKEYWTIGYSETWGRWQVRRRDLDDPRSYKLVEDLGRTLKAAAIEFDGDFLAAEGATHVAEVTDALPWVFVITASDQLIVRRVRSDISEAVLLDTNVKSISICRCFRSIQWGVDMGFTVAYLKTDGTAWYQTRTVTQSGYVWSGPISISDAGSGNDGIQVFRLLDYRTGIYVNGVNKLYISDREYIGNTVKSEFVDVDVSIPFKTVPFRNVVEDPTADFEIIEVSRYSDHVVKVVANYPIFDFDPRWQDITFDGAGTQRIEYMLWSDGALYIHMAETIGAYNGLRFQCRANNRKGYYVSPQCMPTWPAVSFMLRPDPITPTEFVNCDVAISTVLNIREKQIYQVEYTETVECDVAVDTALTILEMVTSDVTIQAETVECGVQITSALNLTQTGTSPV